MKKLFILFVSILTALNMQAQAYPRSSVVTFTVSGDRNTQITVDGKSNNRNNNNWDNRDKSNYTFNNLSTGQHSFQVGGNDNYSRRPERIASTFNLRSGFDMLINVKANGSLELIETKRGRVTDDHAAMGNADFNNIMASVRNERYANGKRMVIANAFNNNNLYFTTSQASQLLLQVNSENYRLELAKLSYRGITDRNNFGQMYNLLNNPASDEELRLFVNNYYEDRNHDNEMDDTRFGVIFQDAKRQWPASTQLSFITNAFNNSNNVFTTSQDVQLIQLSNDENSRIRLAKLAYPRTSDPENFNQVYSLINSRAGKDELSAFVHGPSAYNNSVVNMSDASFNVLYQTTQQQFLPNEKLNAITNAFNNTENNFTSAQARKLIELVSLENNRLQLAKLSYRSVSDRGNFNQLNDLFTSQGSRDELDLYVRGYRE